MTAFKAYDVRGIYPGEVNELLAEKVGLVFPDVVKMKKVVVGRDMRSSSKKLQDAVMKGLTKRGIEVYDIGLASTPKAYFSCFFFGFDAGVIITASHNGKEYNGIKLIGENARGLNYESGLKEIEDRANAGKWTESSSPGSVIPFLVDEEYALFLKKFVHYTKKLNIVMDAGNGMGLTDFFELPSENITKVNETPDGSFPNYTPNPTLPENRKELIKKVLKTGADIGIGFDGDADRAGFIDETGEYIPADFILALLIDQFLESGDKVVCELNVSRIVDEVAKAKGVKVIRTRVGRSYVTDTMRSSGARFGAEGSGHFYFKEFSYADSGMLAAIYVLNVLGNSNKKLSSLIAPYRKFISHEENFEVKSKEGLLEKVEASFEGAKSKLDGVSIVMEDVWFNVRPSNTEPLLRLRAEGVSKEAIDKVVKRVEEIIR